jgi:hypothetical protein
MDDGAMTGSDEQSAGLRRDRRAKDAHERADQARQRAVKAAVRLAELQSHVLLLAQGAEPKGSTVSQAQRASERAEESRVLALQSAENAAAAARASADMHASAATLYDQLADLGLGDVETHRRQAHQHRDAAESDRAEALVDDRLAEQARQRMAHGQSAGGGKR